MNHPLPMGRRFRFHPSAEAIAGLRYDAPSIEGHVTSVDRTSTGHWRYRLRNDDLVPVQPSIERIVYSHEGSFEPVDQAPDAAPQARFERLRDAGGGPERLHDAINALRLVVGRAGESNLDVWQRWSCYIGSTDIAHKTGEQIARWMAAQLIRQPWIDSALPRAGVAAPSQTTVEAIHRAIAQHQRSAEELDRFRAAEEARIWDVETLQPDAPEIATARAALASMATTTARHRAELDQDLVIAARAEAAARQREIEGQLRCWTRPDLRDLRKRPATTAIFGWFPCDYAGVTAWSDNAMADLVSEPHLPRWESQRSTLRTEQLAPGLERNIPTSEGIAVEPIAHYLSPNRKSDAFVVLASRCSVSFVAAKYWRYFASKYGQIQFHLHPKNPVNDTFSVWHDGRRVGVVMPLKRPPMTREEVEAMLVRADALRAADAHGQAA